MFKVLIFLLISTSVLANDPVSELRVKRYFVSKALSIVQRLGEDAPQGMREMANPRFVEVVSGNLIDNRGSIVDAIGFPGGVRLQRERWLSFIDQGLNVDLLVLHELFRMIGINDDSFRVSIPLFREHLDIQSQEKFYCDTNRTTISVEQVEREFWVEGTAVSQTQSRVFSTIGNSNSSVINQAKESALHNGAERCRQENENSEFTPLFYGNISYQNSNRNGFVRRNTTITLKIKCSYQNIVELSRRRSRELYCRKVSLCVELAKDLELNEVEDNLLNLSDREGC